MQCGVDLLKYPKKMAQICPLCGTEHPIFIQGIVRNPEKERMFLPVLDRGYSFCNCRNIFFTDWSNMDSRVYDEGYHDKYQTKESTEAIRRYSEYFPLMIEHKAIESFAEIGAINTALLDEAKEMGWKTTGIDINPNAKSDKHEIMIWDVESGLNGDYGRAMTDTFDVIFASHIFEHFKDPLKVAKNLKAALNDSGLLFVAMPDPWFIDWTRPHTWVHWHLREHHILWDMESFIEALEELGYKCVFSKRNDTPKFTCWGDYHLLFQKVTNA
jgi:SAM-dependent methyltransferase